MFPSRRAALGGDVFRDEYSLEFDGTDDRIYTGNIVNLSANDTYTFSAWINVSATTMEGIVSIGNVYMSICVSDGYLEARNYNGGAVLTNTAVDAGVVIDLVFTQDSGDLGVLDGPVGTTGGADAVLDGILGIVSISNYTDMINGQIATKNNIGLVLKGASSSKSIYVGGIIRESGTARAADAIDIRLGILKD